jgi:tRNA dimethylallyltransferase
MFKKKPIIVITGPTASGKTALAIKLAKRFNGEIINADSRSIYREMDIATSKPSIEETKVIPHHLINIVNPDEVFTLSDYQKLALEKIKEVQSRDKTPFLVGGTGLYIDAVVYNFNLTETKPDLKLRKKLEKDTIKELAEKLKGIDPESFETIDLKNKRRLIRALEVALSTKKSFIISQKRETKPENILYLALDVEREMLYQKINQRIDQWLKTGLIEETKYLASKYSFDLPALSAISYQEILKYLNNKISLKEAAETMKKRTRNYAKRQLTWFKSNKDVVWIKNEGEAEENIKKFLK